MNAFPYLFPLLTCLLIYLSKGDSVDVKSYVLTVLALWWLTRLIYLLFKKYRESATEYLGAYVTVAIHEDAWVERRVETRRVQVGTDKSGRAIYHNVQNVRHVSHPDQWYARTNIGSNINISRRTYNGIRMLWGTREHHSSITGNHIVGGVRHCQQYQFADVTAMFDFQTDEPSPFDYPDYAERFVTVTTSHRYTNKIRRSHSIFKFEKVSKEEKEAYGLYDYPEVVDNNQECILGREFPPSVHRAFSLFNAYYGAKHQIRVFILLFDADKDITVSEKQRAYWSGGNKNELVVCLGVDDSDTVRWCHAFSWMDEPIMTVKTEGYFREHEQLDLLSFNQWLRANLSHWQRKAFKDFDYIHVPLSPVQYWTWFLLCLLANVVAVLINVK